MPGISLIEPSLCVLNVPALLTLRHDSCHAFLRPPTAAATQWVRACYGVFLWRERITLVLLCLYWLVICSMSKSYFYP